LVVLSQDPRFKEIDAMDGASFELALVDLLGLLGYQDVERTDHFDKGADILATDEGSRIAIQAKRHSSAVGISAIRQVIDGVKRYDCSRALVITNSYFTQQAIECAEAHGVELWDRKVLADFLEGDAPKVDSAVCAECGKPVTKGVSDWCLARPGRYGGAVFCRGHQARSNRRAA
jgi:HJR/Mrr/RecB family endonuclease